MSVTAPSGRRRIGLGLPSMPADRVVPVLAPRRKTRQLDVGGVGVGSDSPVSVQSMTTTVTADINATLQQIAELTASGCQIVRVACRPTTTPTRWPSIARKSQIPVIADIHFQPKYVFAAIDAGCAAVRVNPGNIKAFDDKVGEIARAAKAAGTPIRIGVNAGSLDKRLLAKYGKATPEALVESALWECSLFEEHDFRDIKISVKHNDPVIMVRAYELLAEQCDYPLHLGRDRGRAGVPGHHQVRGRLRRAAVAGASATPSGCRCPRRRSRRSRSACRSWSRSTCASAAWRSCPARPAGAPRSTSTRWPSRSPPGSRAWTCRCGWP